VYHFGVQASRDGAAVQRARAGESPQAARFRPAQFSALPVAQGARHVRTLFAYLRSTQPINE
jgi:hypothetical protein